MYAAQLNWNFNTTSTAYLVKSEDRRSLRKSQPKYNTVFVYSLLQILWIRNCCRPNEHIYVAYEIAYKKSFTGRTGLCSGKAWSQTFHKVWRTVTSL